MSDDYDRLRRLLFQDEKERLDALDHSVKDALGRLHRVPEQLADEIEKGLHGQPSRLGNALAEVTVGSLELAVRRRPKTVVDAVYPVMGPAIRRSVSETLRQMADDLDQALGDAFTLRALRWRLEARRTGMPYAQVVMRHTARYHVEHLFMIEPETGRLLGHVTASGLSDLDPYAIAGMFSAIQQFVRDSVQGEEGDDIASATVGDYRLVVGRGPSAKLVAFVRGVPSTGFGTRLLELNEELHLRHGEHLSDPDVSFESPQGFLEQAQLDDLNRIGDARVREHRGWGLRLTLALVAAALVVYGWNHYHWTSLSQRIQSQLVAETGLVVSQWDDSRRGTLRVTGLRDPLAADPRTWLSRHYPDVDAQWQLGAYASLEPKLVTRRVAQRLGLPEAIVEYDDKRALVRLNGRVPFAAWHQAIGNAASLSLPGIAVLETDQLNYPERERIDRLIGDLQSVRILFDPGTATPNADMDATIADMRRTLQELQEAGASYGIAFRLRALGYTDESGTYPQNRDLRQQRAEWLAARLMTVLLPPSSITIDQDAINTLPGSSVRATSITIKPFPVKP